MALHVRELGDPGGPILVALHGLTGHGARFRAIAETTGRRVVAPDLRGHGRSTFDPPWTTERHVADVLEALTGLEGPLDLLGFSYGGRIAAALAAAALGRVARLVLLDP